MHLLLAYLQASDLTLEWTTREGRTFQVSGHDGMAGRWERFLREDQHPTRSAVSRVEIVRAWEEAQEPLVLYRVRKDGPGAERLTRAQLLARAEGALSAVVRRA